MNTDYIYKYVDRHISDKRRLHTKGVADEAVKLADIYGEDVLKARVAALFHDIYKGKRVSTLNKLVKSFGLDDKYLDNPNLAHGKLASLVMRTDCGVDDEDILNAVSYHTTGRAGMSMLEKIIFIADVVEPSRDYPGVEDLRNLAAKNIDKACLVALKNEIKLLRDKKIEPDADTLAAECDLERRLRN